MRQKEQVIVCKEHHSENFGCVCVKGFTRFRLRRELNGIVRVV